MNCPLCNNKAVFFLSVNLIGFWKCENCGLIYKEPHSRLNRDIEKKRYLFHQNSIADRGYIDFLNQLIIPLLNFVRPEDSGLDFGCGHTPVLSEILKINSYNCDVYDPFFFPNADFSKKYDFIVSTEAFEHFFYPEKELRLISSILKPNAILGIMTELYDQISDFHNWYYHKDPTHVCFFGNKSMKFICKKYGYIIEYCDNKRVIILRKTN
jgi:SAM-dependent methyltransferase